MAKLTLLLACLTLGIFGTTKSASFECQFYTREWGSLGSVYLCEVKNSVSITSSDAAQIDSISGTHEAGYNNDDVEGFYVYRLGQIHYFPRGLDKIFKNLKGILITSTGLKELHQSDLKVFPNLRGLFLYESNLEILEENLFEFNPNLDYIYLNSNKISHIDPNVFDKLTKLKTLDLNSNTCINMRAENNPTAVQNIIRTFKSQCTNLDYSNLEQKVKNLEAQLKNLNSEKFKKKFENLENEVKNSKFLNFFQHKFNSIFDAKAAQIEDTQREVPKKIAKLDEKLTAMSTEMSNLKSDVLTVQPAIIQNLGRIQNLVEDQSQKIATIESKLSTLKQGENQDTTTTLKDIEASNSKNFAAIMNFIENLSKKMEAIEVKLAEMDSTQEKVMNKVYKIESDSNNNKVEINKKLKDILYAVY